MSLDPLIANAIDDAASIGFRKGFNIGLTIGCIVATFGGILGTAIGNWLR